MIMKSLSSKFGRGGLLLAMAGAMLAPHVSEAFPPAPHHVIFGTVRDQYGTPLMTSQAQIILTTPSGVQLTTQVIPGVDYDQNFQLEVPMDSGLTSDLYTPNALIQSAPFTMTVVIGQTTNVPIQMTGNFAHLGQPGQQTRIDLTLGEDANGDGIPDEWELAFLASIGSNLGLTNLSAGLRLTRDGLTLRQQFLLGNYPFDPQDPFVLTLVDPNNDSPILQFTAMTGRYYTLLGSADLKTWTPLSFQIPSDGTGATHTFYFAQTIQSVQIQATQPASGPPVRFFKMMLQ